MEAHPTIPYLREIILFLVAAAVAVPLLHRLRISPVLAYLILGALIGPYGLGLLAQGNPVLSQLAITETEGVSALAELGVVFLLFMIGLELSLDRLWSMRRLVFGLGSLQVLVTGVMIGSIAWAFGNSPAASIVLGACLALSSTAVVLQLLMANRRLGTPTGRTVFAILLMQDLAVVPILFSVTVLGAPDDGGVWLGLVAAVAKAIITVVLIYAVGRLLLRPAFRLIAQRRSPEMFMSAILLTVIGTSAITGFAGLSMALGAFLAGLLLAGTEFRHEIEVDIEPFKGLMLGLFFMSVGMGIDWRVVASEPLWILAAVPGLFLLKALVTATLCRLFGMSIPVSLEAGLLLGQGGEFAFVVVGAALALGILLPEVGQFMLIVTALTMLATPLVAAAARRLADRLRTRAVGAEGEEVEIEALDSHVILAGFGRVGRTIASILVAEQVPFIALDKDAGGVAAARAEGHPIYFGDASRFDILDKAHLANAASVVLTMDDAEAAEQIAAEIRSRHPLIPILARARDGEHAARLRAAGATIAVPENVEASLQLAGRLLEEIGTSEDIIARRLAGSRLAENA